MNITRSHTNGHNVADWERLLSAGLGGLLLAGSWRRSWAGAALGAALAYRGVAGHCHVYQALGLNSADGEVLPGTVEFSRSVTVNKSPEELFRFFVNETDKMARWASPVLESRKLADGRYHWTVDGPGGEYSWTSRLTEAEPGRRIVWESEEGDVDNWGGVSFQETPRGTRVTVEIGYKIPGGRLTSALARLTGDEPHESLEGALRQLKAHLEAGEVPTIEGQPVGAGQERG